MAEISITIEGLEEANNHLKSLAQAFPEKADRLIEDGAEKIFGDSQRLCPVDTGTLLASGSHTHEFLRSEVGYSAPYAAFQEYGTSKMQAQPYLRPASEEGIPEILAEAKSLLKD